MISPSPLKDGYESDSTLVYKRHNQESHQRSDPSEERAKYWNIQRGGEVPLSGLRKLAPEKPKGKYPNNNISNSLEILFKYFKNVLMNFEVLFFNI